jgi:hypothetical protein
VAGAGASRRVLTRVNRRPFTVLTLLSAPHPRNADRGPDRLGKAAWFNKDLGLADKTHVGRLFGAVRREFCPLA